MTEKSISQGFNFLMKKHGVKLDDLSYIGFTDCSFKAKGAALLQYNIMKSDHILYKSTVAYKHKWS